MTTENYKSMAQSTFHIFYLLRLINFPPFVGKPGKRLEWQIIHFAMVWGLNRSAELALRFLTLSASLYWSASRISCLSSTDPKSAQTRYLHSPFVTLSASPPQIDTSGQVSPRLSPSPAVSKADWPSCRVFAVFILHWTPPLLYSCSPLSHRLCLWSLTAR